MSENNLTDKNRNFKDEFTEVNNIRLHYVTLGQGKLVMFLHGFPEFWYMWKKQLVEFGKDYQAVAFDMRGYNLSSKPNDPDQYQIDILVEDLRALAEKITHEKFIIVAHDWGGVVAWSFANRHPDYLEKLIIINAPHPGVFARELASNPAQQKASQYILLFRSSEAETILSDNNYAVLFNAFISTGIDLEFSDEDRKIYIEAWSQLGALTGGLNYYRAASFVPPSPSEKKSEPLTDLLNTMTPESLEVKVPTLVIWGEKDSACLTGNLNGLGEYVHDLTIKRIPEGSHWIVREQPERINSLIRGFIK